MEPAMWASFDRRAESCGVRTIDWYLTVVTGSKSDLEGIYERSWNPDRGTHITSVANELTLATGNEYAALRLPTGRLNCTGRCSPIVVLLDNGIVETNGHFVVVLLVHDESFLWYDVDNGYYRTSRDSFVDSWTPFELVAVAPMACVEKCFGPSLPALVTQ